MFVHFDSDDVDAELVVCSVQQLGKVGRRCFA